MGRPGEKRPGLAPLARKRSWPAALLGASILSSCFLLTQAQGRGTTELPVTWNPQDPLEGQNVTLSTGGNSENIVRCSWYRGRVIHAAKLIFTYILVSPVILRQINGAAHTGRETVGIGCSLHIRNLTSSDSGNYTVLERAMGAIGHANIVVSAPGSTQLLPVAETNIPWIITGCLAVILALIGALYFFLRARRRRDRISSQTQTALQIYENVSPSGQVNPEKSSPDNNVYQTLDLGSQSVYDELRNPRNY